MSVSFFQSYLASLGDALASIDLGQIEYAARLMREARANKRTIFVYGNGGSMATASHFVCDVIKGASFGRDEKFRMLCLLDNSPTLSAYANDVGYAEVIVEQLKNFASEGDLVIAISGSGNSPNVVAATAWGRGNGCRTIAMTGRDGGQLKEFADCHINVKEQHMGRIEDGHMVACHMLAYLFMEQE